MKPRTQPFSASNSGTLLAREKPVVGGEEERRGGRGRRRLLAATAAVLIVAGVPSGCGSAEPAGTARVAPDNGDSELRWADA